MISYYVYSYSKYTDAIYNTIYSNIISCLVCFHNLRNFMGINPGINPWWVSSLLDKSIYIILPGAVAIQPLDRNIDF